MHSNQDKTVEEFSQPSPFMLNDSEVKYIVNTTQCQISELSQIKEFSTPDEALINHKKIMELMRVLDAFCVYKTWCS